MNPGEAPRACPATSHARLPVPHPDIFKEKEKPDMGKRCSRCWVTALGGGPSTHPDFCMEVSGSGVTPVVKRGSSHPTARQSQRPAGHTAAHREPGQPKGRTPSSPSNEDRPESTGPGERGQASLRRPPAPHEHRHARHRMNTEPALTGLCPAAMLYPTPSSHGRDGRHPERLTPRRKRSLKSMAIKSPSPPRSTDPKLHPCVLGGHVGLRLRI